MRVRRGLVSLLALATLAGAGCTSNSPSALTPTPSSTTPSPNVIPTPTPATFDAGRVIAHDRVLSETIGVREAGSDAYRKAADYAEGMLAGYGYTVTRQRVPLPAGASQGVPVPAGSTENVIAAPPGFTASTPHLLVGAHLDTVAKAPGANDNGSGAAMVLELARLASLEATALPIVWIEFGGEERRFKGTSGATFGSRYYLDHLSAEERASLRGVLAVDMVGHGIKVLVCSGGETPKGFINALLATAARLGIPSLEQVILRFFSDHTPFEKAGFTVAWLWAGDHSSVHTPRDTMPVIQVDEIDRIGRVAWETLRSLRL